MRLHGTTDRGIRRMVCASRTVPRACLGLRSQPYLAHETTTALPAADRSSDCLALAVKEGICARFMSEQLDTQTAAKKLGIKRNPEAGTVNLNGDVFVFCHYYLN